eukprot:2683453-Prymnesium_polylepis.2
MPPPPQTGPLARRSAGPRRLLARWPPPLPPRPASAHGGRAPRPAGRWTRRRRGAAAARRLPPVDEG